jgi:hypothetical protein
MKMKLAALVALALPLLSACLSHERARQMSIAERNFDIGRVVTEIPIPKPSSVVPLDEGTSLHVYEFKDTGCKWSYAVDNNTKRVLSWKFIGDPDLCYLTLGGI